ncbi:unnamed protein product [Meganyctiphanes norvegica]|uniref:C2H2-type domain-containing protein n=1 Tax=Meganyctiphanes norvegica TaxID=48144 RepID=A0AAV2PJA3_MEGNR
MDFLGHSFQKSYLRTYTRKKSYQCSYCDRTSLSKCNIIRHMKKHIGEKLYQCCQCGKDFSWKRNFVSHLSTHIGEKFKKPIHKTIIRVQEDPQQINNTYELSTTEDSEKQVEIEKSIQSDLEKLYDIIKSETFLEEEFVEIEFASESKALDDV